MNGRLYDSKLARFLSPDPFLQDPSNTQNYNRYSYCLNNPFAFTDPSGYVYGGANSNYVPGGTTPYYNNPGLSNFNTGSFHSTYDNDWGNYAASNDLMWYQSGCSAPGTSGGAGSSYRTIMDQVEICLSLIHNGYGVKYIEYNQGYALNYNVSYKNGLLIGMFKYPTFITYSQASLVSQIVGGYGDSRSGRNEDNYKNSFAYMLFGDLASGKANAGDYGPWCPDGAGFEVSGSLTIPCVVPYTYSFSLGIAMTSNGFAGYGSLGGEVGIAYPFGFGLGFKGYMSESYGMKITDINKYKGNAIGSELNLGVFSAFKTTSSENDYSISKKGFKSYGMSFNLIPTFGLNSTISKTGFLFSF
jgi:hypothetical protein